MARRRTRVNRAADVVLPSHDDHSIGGIPSPGLHMGKMDETKARLASRIERQSRIATGMQKEAGMVMDGMWMRGGVWGNLSLDAYHTSYASGNTMYGGGVRDIPTYFMMMNQQNGGVLYWPVSLREKMEWYRYFVRCIYLSDKDLGEILMSDGTTKSIKDVEVGDEVITGIGTVRKVKNKFERRCVEDKAVTLKAWCLQNHLKTTHHHPYQILRKESIKDETKYKDNIDFKPEWVHAEHINPGDYVMFAPVASDPNSKITNDEARFLGYYAAEGSIIWGKRCVGTEEGKGFKWHQEKIKVPVGVSFTINLREKNTLGNGILDMAKKVFGVEGRIVRERGNSVEIAVNGREVGEFCLYHVGVGSATKKLSQELVMASNDARKEFIVGYMEGDGHQYDNRTSNKGKIIIGTTSKMLASQVQLMALSAGVMCRYAIYDRTEGSGFKSETKQIHITIPSWSANGLVESSDKWSDVATAEQKHCAFFINGYAAFKVRSVEYSQEDDTVYNIEVDAEGDEKSYICNGMVTHNTDAYCGRAVELLCDLPMSKISLNMPHMEDKVLRQDIHDFFSYQCERINLFERLHQMLWEYNICGNSFVFHEWDEKDKMWSKIVILPPEEINCFTYPFSDNARIEYRPEKLLSIIKKSIEQGGTSGLEDPFLQSIVDRIPADMVKMVQDQGCIVMDSDPFSGNEIGSFVYQFARRKHPYHDLGASVLERVLVPMLQKENYRYTQLALATRNMTPKNKISAPGLNQEEIDQLRAQIDLSYMDPDYSVVTNYEWTWEQIGAEGRILDLTAEHEMIENHVFAGLGVTRELLTGEGTYSGNRITVEILNSVFLLTREMLQRYVEQYLFKPVAHANGWYETDKRGLKKYWYPKLGFNRLTIRDNQEVFESLFQLYQKGSLPVDIIYELFNLDVDSMHDRIKKELFTVKDPTFNRTVEEVNSEIGRNLVEKTDIVDRVAKYLGLQLKQVEGEGGGEENLFGDQPQEAAPEEANQSEGGGNTDTIVDAVHGEMPPDATREDVKAVVEKLVEKGVEVPQ